MASSDIPFTPKINDDEIESLKEENFKLKVAIGATIGVAVVASLGYYFFNRGKK